MPAAADSGADGDAGARRWLYASWGSVPAGFWIPEWSARVCARSVAEARCGAGESAGLHGGANSGAGPERRDCGDYGNCGGAREYQARIHYGDSRGAEREDRADVAGGGVCGGVEVAAELVFSSAKLACFRVLEQFKG